MKMMGWTDDERLAHADVLVFYARGRKHRASLDLTDALRCRALRLKMCDRPSKVGRVVAADLDTRPSPPTALRIFWKCGASKVIPGLQAECEVSEKCA